MLCARVQRVQCARCLRARLLCCVLHYRWRFPFVYFGGDKKVVSIIIIITQFCGGTGHGDSRDDNNDATLCFFGC